MIDRSCEVALTQISLSFKSAQSAVTQGKIAKSIKTHKNTES
jgi:hypothetical protein